MRARGAEERGGWAAGCRFVTPGLRFGLRLRRVCACVRTCVCACVYVLACVLAWVWGCACGRAGWRAGQASSVKRDANVGGREAQIVAKATRDLHMAAANVLKVPAHDPAHVPDPSSPPRARPSPRHHVLPCLRVPVRHRP